MQTGRQTDRQAERLAGKQPGVMDDLSQCERKGGMSCKIERARATCCREGGGRPPFLLTVIGKENARPRSLASRPCVWLAQVPRRPPYLGRRLRPRFPRLGVGGEGAQDLPGDGDRGPVRREILLPRRSRDPGMNVCYTQQLLTICCCFCCCCCCSRKIPSRSLAVPLPPRAGAISSSPDTTSCLPGGCRRSVLLPLPPLEVN